MDEKGRNEGYVYYIKSTAYRNGYFDGHYITKIETYQFRSLYNGAQGQRHHTRADAVLEGEQHARLIGYTHDWKPKQ